MTEIWKLLLSEIEIITKIKLKGKALMKVIIMQTIKYKNNSSKKKEKVKI